MNPESSAEYLQSIHTDGPAWNRYLQYNAKEMIERQQNDYDWHFTFLGANQDAFAEAGGMGIHAAGVADYAADRVAAAYMATGGKVARMRAQRRAGGNVSNEFTDEERGQMK
ncbi:MAG TPA: hypothetical protein QF564_09265 [Pirellulaceae bacterium]|nr:hypothetical protein [Pirellulaceae bacterium]